MQATQQMADAIEQSAWIQLFQSASSDVRSRFGLDALRIAGAAALCCRQLDSPLLNRAIGISASQGQETWTRILSLFGGVEGRGYMVHVWRDAAEARTIEWLKGAGLVRYRRSWVKFVRGRQAVAEPNVPFRIEHVPSQHASEFGRVLSQGFELAEVGVSLFSAVVGRPRWYPIGAYDSERMVSAGLLFVEGDVGYLMAGTTLADSRGRGAQGAVMRARVALALDLGCRWVVTETGEAVAGAPNHSYNNMLRNRFTAIGSRDNYAPAGLEWDHGRAVAPRRLG
jgi:hypothetical protein